MLAAERSRIRLAWQARRNRAAGNDDSARAAAALFALSRQIEASRSGVSAAFDRNWIAPRSAGGALVASYVTITMGTFRPASWIRSNSEKSCVRQPKHR